MIGRLIEDGIFVARLAWNYHKAPTRVRQLGFYNPDQAIPVRERVSYAWKATNGVGRQRQQ